MPIRFRCAYCNQLMGISRRKVGNVVRCPKCGGQVVVPNPEDGQVVDDGPEDANAPAHALEDPELERLLGGDSNRREAGTLARALAPYIGMHFIASPLAVATLAWRAQAWALKLALVGQLMFLGALFAGLRMGGLQAGAWAVSAVMLPYFGWYFWSLARWRTIPDADAS